LRREQNHQTYQDGKKKPKENEIPEDNTHSPEEETSNEMRNETSRSKQQKKRKRKERDSGLQARKVPKSTN